MRFVKLPFAVFPCFWEGWWRRPKGWGGPYPKSCHPRPVRRSSADVEPQTGRRPGCTDQIKLLGECENCSLRSSVNQLFSLSHYQREGNYSHETKISLCLNRWLRKQNRGRKSKCMYTVRVDGGDGPFLNLYSIVCYSLLQQNGAVLSRSYLCTILTSLFVTRSQRRALSLTVHNFQESDKNYP